MEGETEKVEPLGGHEVGILLSERKVREMALVLTVVHASLLDMGHAFIAARLSPVVKMLVDAAEEVGS